MSAPSQSALQAEAEARLRFEMLLADVCAEFVNVSPADLDSKIENAQRVICEALGVDHSSVWQVSENDPDQLVMTHAYRDPKLKPLPSRPVLKEYFPWAQSKILKKQTISVANTTKVPSDAARDRDSWLQYGVQSTLAFPLYVGSGSVIGLLAFDSTKKREWSEPLQRRLQILAFVFAQALDRKRAEQELSEANERLRLALEAGSAGGWDYDLKTGKNVWFGTAHEQLGMTPDETSGSRKEFWDRIHEDDRERVEHALRVAKETRGEYAEDVRVVWRDGTTHWLRSRGRFQYDVNGEAERSLGISLDITERKMAEERLREYERAVENAEEMIAVVDREYRYLIANRQFLKLRNMTREQVVGHFVREVLEKGVFEAVVKPKVDECFQGRIVRYEMKYNYAELGERDVLVSYFPIEGANGIDRVACILQDITDRKRSEESLRESEQRFRLAAQTGKMYSFEWDVTTDVVVRSPELVKVLGGAEPLPVSRQQFVDTIYPDDRSKFIATIAGLTPEHPTAEVIYRVRSSDRALVWLKSSGRAFFDHEGKMLRVIGMVADITDLKRAEEALAGMTRKLIAAQEQERARIGRELHDDINQRLAMLGVELEQLQENPSEVQSRVQELRKLMTELSNDVQAMSHDLHSSKLEYLGVVAGIKSWCKGFAERQRTEIDFKSDVPTAVPLEIGLSLFRVLQEALNNAIKHSGVKRIEVQLREDSGEIHLIVSDSGKGFDVEPALQGKGLGLTSMRERVRLVNGTISIESKPMGGTTIHVRVPLGSKQAPAKTA